MTDEQIVQALACCNHPLCKCDVCPYKKMDEMCFDDVKRDALSLIKRQKVEIDSLKIANEKMYTANQEQQAQIEHLTAEIAGLKRFIKDLMKD